MNLIEVPSEKFPEEEYSRSLGDPDAYWLEQAKLLTWVRFPTKAGDWSFAREDFHIRWFEDGLLNVSVNCLDRHLSERSQQLALLWEPDDPAEAPRHFTYAQAHAEVCRMANVLKGLGVARGDRVTIYMPMIPETAFAMLACARIGAIHSVVFGGFSADALAGRIGDCGSRVVITADQGRRGGKLVPIKACVDEALKVATGVDRVLVVQAMGVEIEMNPDRDIWYHDAAKHVGMDCAPEPMSAEDPLFILYTSGSTGRPKGVVHTTGGYLLWTTLTHRTVFDYSSPEVFWCSADLGWITGHSYIVYGPLANGAVSLMYEGVPNWPSASRMWEVVDRHEVSILYTAPTALRALMREGDVFVKATSRRSLRLLGSVGEPMNPEAWQWYHEVVGGGRCPILDTWWQTETGGHMITPLPKSKLKPGSAGHPFFGVEPKIVGRNGDELSGVAEGNLVITRSWPGQMRDIWGDDTRFFETYFSVFPGAYFTGDGARRDEDGHYWITGRVDDVVNVSGHRLGTAEIESALVLHEAVAEAAVVGVPHDIKGQAIYAFVTLNADVGPSEVLNRALRNWVRREIGPVATPDAIQFASSLPKTRSGKIMRRILRKIACGETANIGDTSTLADPAVVSALVAGLAQKEVPVGTF